MLQEIKNVMHVAQNDIINLCQLATGAKSKTDVKTGFLATRVLGAFTFAAGAALAVTSFVAIPAHPLAGLGGVVLGLGLCALGSDIYKMSYNSEQLQAGIKLVNGFFGSNISIITLNTYYKPMWDIFFA